MTQRGLRRPEKTINPEREIILCCSRSQMDSAATDRVRALLRGGPNWPEVVANSIQHRVTPTFYDGVTTAGADLLSPSQRELLRESAQLSVQNSLALLQELLRLYQLFLAAKIPVIPYKGPVLARLAYGSFAKREFVDLDFAVPQQYIPQATAILQAAGYCARFDLREAHDGRGGFAPGQYPFSLSERFLQVELHTERTLRYFLVPLDFNQLYQRLIDVEIAGRCLRTFSIEDTLVMLCVHGAKHFWERLAWILDIAGMIALQPVDWTLALRIAAEMKSTRLLLLGLYLAHTLCGASLPQFVLEQAQQDKNVLWLVRRVSEQYAENHDASTGVFARATFRLRSRDTMRQGLRHMLRLTMRPTESDRQMVRLPRVLAPLYMLVRPWRLLRERGVGFKSQIKPDLAIYEPTPPEFVAKMLRLAGISPTDVLYDLGCGDGRIVVAAAKQYGIRAVGIDIDAKRIAEARRNARRHGVENLVLFHQGDAKQWDVSGATVVTLFLGADANLKLVDRLRSQLRPGARIISRNFGIYGWTPERSEKHVLPGGICTNFYLWTIKQTEEETLVIECAAPKV